MKTLSLDLRSAEVLTKPELRQVRGGYVVYVCYCGFVSDPKSGEKEILTQTLESALKQAASDCNGQGATCRGEERKDFIA